MYILPGIFECFSCLASSVVAVQAKHGPLRFAHAFAVSGENHGIPRDDDPAAFFTGYRLSPDLRRVAENSLRPFFVCHRVLTPRFCAQRMISAGSELSIRTLPPITSW